MRNEINARLPRDRTCAARARRLLDESLAEGVGRSTLHDVKLVVSELVDNAYVHGEGEIRLRVARTPHSVMVEVKDEGQGEALAIREAAGEDRGYGLRIVDRVAQRWGTYEGSTHVWAELPVEQ